MDQSPRDYVNRRVSAMRTERTSFISHWKELAEFVQPRRGRFLLYDQNKGGKRHQSIINSAATQALGIARSGLLAGSMSPSRPYFALQTPDPDMMEFEPVKIWLRHVELVLRAIFNASNLYSMVPTLIGELLLFGTGCMTHVDDYEDVARFYTHTIGSYMLAQNDRYVVDTLAREMMMTAYQVIEKFGIENVSTGVRNCYDRGDYDSWFPVFQFIEPNERYQKGKALAKFKKFRSVYYEPENKYKDTWLSQSGFDEFPAYCPRWDVTGEDIYGTDCPGMTALGDIKGLQLEERRKAQAIDKLVNPPLQGPAELRNQPINVLPGGANLFNQSSSNGKGLVPVYQVDPKVRELAEDIEGVKRRIDKAFYVDMFLAITNMEGIQPRNEFDLLQRNQERLLQVGPVLQRLHGELLDKMIDRTFNQAVRANILPPPPDELSGVPLKIDYISTLAMAQRATATEGIERLSNYVGVLVQSGFTEVMDKFDADQAVDEYSHAVGVPPRVVRSDDVVALERQARAEKQRAAEGMQMAQAAANTAKMASDAKTDDDNALTDIASAMQAQQ